MPKKKQERGGEGEGKASKDLKIITVQVVTRDRVIKNPRQMSLLYLIDKLGPIHEKTLQHVVHRVQELGADLGYKDFSVVGGVPYSPTLKSDVVALLYVGFIETEPTMYRKLRVTGDGKEALEKYYKPLPELEEVLSNNFEEIRNMASLIDNQVDLQVRRRGLVERRRPRRLF
ncbi:MAG: hypothetical protein LRS46_00370 [Desulfurococcales archaeon]|nr:hypothetical protein [Desulfurococcales archaeon]